MGNSAMPTQQIKWYLASDSTTPATDMSVALVGRPSPGQGFYGVALGCYVQLVWPATGSPAGAFGLAESGDGVNFDAISLASADQQPTQPTGAAGHTSITLPVGAWLSPYIEVTWTPTSGGTGALPTGTFNTK